MPDESGRKQKSCFYHWLKRRFKRDPRVRHHNVQNAETLNPQLDVPVSADVIPSTRLTVLNDTDVELLNFKDELSAKLGRPSPSCTGIKSAGSSGSLISSDSLTPSHKSPSTPIKSINGSETGRITSDFLLHNKLAVNKHRTRRPPTKSTPEQWVSSKFVSTDETIKPDIGCTNFFTPSSGTAVPNLFLNGVHQEQSSDTQSLDSTNDAGDHTINRTEASNTIASNKPSTLEAPLPLALDENPLASNFKESPTSALDTTTDSHQYSPMRSNSELMNNSACDTVKKMSRSETSNTASSHEDNKPYPDESVLADSPPSVDLVSNSTKHRNSFMNAENRKSNENILYEIPWSSSLDTDIATKTTTTVATVDTPATGAPLTVPLIRPRSMFIVSKIGDKSDIASTHPTDKVLTQFSAKQRVHSTKNISVINDKSSIYNHKEEEEEETELSDASIADKVRMFGSVLTKKPAKQIELEPVGKHRTISDVNDEQSTSRVLNLARMFEHAH